MSSPAQSARAEQGSSGNPCNSELKLGDPCDSCWKGIMLPPGGLSYYEKEMREKGATRKAVAQPKIVCPRCGHWHNSLGLDFESGF